MYQDFDTGDWKGSMVLVRKLTWKGQEFLAAIRDEAVWSKAKEMGKTHGIPMVFDALKTLAVGLASKALGLSP